MTPLRDRIESFFGALATTFYNHRFKTLFFLLLFIGLLAFKIPALTIDTSSEAMLPAKDEARVIYDELRAQFGQDRMIVITVTTDDVFSEPFLRKLKKFHADIKDQVPYLDDITSLINARDTRGEGDRLIVEDLLKDWPEEKQVDLELLRKRVLGNPSYVNHIVTADGRTTAIVLETEVYHTEETDVLDALDNFGDDAFGEEDASNDNKDAPQKYLSDKQTSLVVEHLRDVIRQYEGPGFETAFAGAPVVIDVFNKCIVSDMKKTFLVSFMGIMIFQGLLFRRVAGVILPSIIVNAALFSTLGLMGWFGVPIKITSTLLPAFLMCVGVADSVHILAVFYRWIDGGGDRKEAATYAFTHSGIPVTLTTLTTAAALLSFAFADLTAIAEMGIFASAGVMLALFYTIIMLPALMAFTPVSPKVSADKIRNRKTMMDRVLLWIAEWPIRYPLHIVIISLILFAVSVHYIFQLRYTEYMVDYFPETMPIRQDVLSIDERLRGATNLEIVIDTGQENGIYEPAILNRIEQAAHYYEQYQSPDVFVGKVFSINEILKETNQALHENKPEFYRIPQDYNTIAQELFLFENSGADDLEKIVDSQFSKTLVSLKLPWVDAIFLDHFIENSVRPYFDTLFAGHAKVTITGMAAIMGRTIHTALKSMTESYILAFIVISAMMVLLVGHLKTGFFSMIPNVLPIVVTLGLMGFLRVPMDMTALMMCSIAIGLVVDDTVHFIYNFRKYYVKSGDAAEAIRITLAGVGRAMLITSIVLSYGFFVLILGELKHGERFGIFTGIAILLALLADFLLAPALMMIITGAYKNGPNKEGETA